MTITLSELQARPASRPDTTQGGSDGSLFKIEDLTAQTLSFILTEYQLSPVLQNLIASYLDEVARLEAAACAVYADVLSLDTAVGAQLDLLGRIIGQVRAGRLDEPYRALLRLRLLINRSDGTLEQMIQIIRIFEQHDANPGSTVSIKDIGNAIAEVRINTLPGLVNTFEDIQNLLDESKAAGVELIPLYQLVPDCVFRFTTVAAYPEKSPDEGFAGIAGPVEGGCFAHVHLRSSSSVLVLESGDGLLLETGDGILLI